MSVLEKVFWGACYQDRITVLTSVGITVALDTGDEVLQTLADFLDMAPAVISSKKSNKEGG